MIRYNFYQYPRGKNNVGGNRYRLVSNDHQLFVAV